MKTVISKQGIDLSDAKTEKVGKENRTITIAGAFLLCFIPLGSVVMLINAYICFTRTYVMVFHHDGMQNNELYRQLNQDEIKHERINSYIYLVALLISRVLPVGYYLMHHNFA